VRQIGKAHAGKQGELVGKFAGECGCYQLWSWSSGQSATDAETSGGWELFVLDSGVVGLSMHAGFTLFPGFVLWAFALA
jgi:hypothetical protein